MVVLAQSEEELSGRMGSRAHNIRSSTVDAWGHSPSLVLVIHNVRSAHNVGSLLRSADGAGVEEVWLSGYSARPARPGKLLLTKAERAVEKTALGAERSVYWKAETKFCRVARQLQARGYELVALEQSPEAANLFAFSPSLRVALVVGNEVRGLEQRVLRRCDRVIEIPLHGVKESLNVAVAGGVALFVVRATMEVTKKGYGT